MPNDATPMWRSRWGQDTMAPRDADTRNA
jgi:hypothetical protein